jgi:predicted dithiol-disulfide oxidoreductase (DUF899 family)
MNTHRIVSQAEWLEARKALLAKEKALTQQREALAEERRALPWVKVEKDYVFDAPEGKEVTLADLFGGKGQLIVQHFMFGPDWNEGCPSCSFWTDNFNGIDVHLAHRDTAFVLVSRGPIDRLEAYRKRMGWNLRWVSSLGNDFNFDFAVSFAPDETALKYNFNTIKPHGQENPGLTAFRRGDDDAIYRTYSTYARGIDMLNGTYQLLDITSKGRDEDALPFSMAWVRRHDKY